MPPLGYRDVDGGFDTGGPGETLSHPPQTAVEDTLSVWLECDNDHENGQVTVEAWKQGSKPPEVVFLGKVVSFRFDGDDAVVELKRVNPDG